MKEDAAKKNALEQSPAGRAVNAVSHAASISSTEEYGRITRSLYFLLSEKTDGSQRKQFYYDRGIIVRGSEEGNTVSGMEEMRMIIEEEREIAKKEAEELKRTAEEAEKELKKKAAEAEKQATVHTTVHIGRSSGLDLEKQISIIAELLRIGHEEARELYKVYS